jgi:hypothetical protein
VHIAAVQRPLVSECGQDVLLFTRVRAYPATARLLMAPRIVLFRARPSRSSHLDSMFRQSADQMAGTGSILAVPQTGWWDSTRRRSRSRIPTTSTCVCPSVAASAARRDLIWMSHADNRPSRHPHNYFPAKIPHRRSGRAVQPEIRPRPAQIATLFLVVDDRVSRIVREQRPGEYQPIHRVERRRKVARALPQCARHTRSGGFRWEARGRWKRLRLDWLRHRQRTAKRNRHIFPRRRGLNLEPERVDAAKRCWLGKPGNRKIQKRTITAPTRCRGLPKLLAGHSRGLPPGSDVCVGHYSRCGEQLVPRAHAVVPIQLDARVGL